MSPDIAEQLRMGIQAAQKGQREQARAILMQVVEQDQNNVQAWLWLSGVVDDLEDRQICLQNVLNLEPNHAAARKGLAQVQAQLARQAVNSTLTSSPSPPPPRSVSGELDDPLLCPYCAVPTKLQDRRCTMCGGKLWIEVGQEDKQRSVWLWILIVLQRLNALASGLGMVGALLSINTSSG